MRRANSPLISTQLQKNLFVALGLLFVLCQHLASIVFKGEQNMREENTTGNNAIWAITTLLVVAIIAVAVYFIFLKGGAPAKENIDIKINTSAPSTK